MLYTNRHPDLDPTVPFDDEALARFRDFLDGEEFTYDPQAFEEHKEAIRLRLRAQIARVKWDQNAESLILAQADPQVQKALSSFDEATKLQASGADGIPGPELPAHLRAEAVGEATAD